MTTYATNYARMSGALIVQLRSALSALKYPGLQSEWALEEAERIESLLKEIEDGKYVEECVDRKGCSF